ncbi:isochorismatase family protein [Cupriavidus basilensis]|uniref:Isochorismatase family protein n=1 Tax=Cupriavidus basilensis TaxID=68895 RepID=A0ABT6AUE0_9BURK|nr:isochorismatase family protein [Cupriavidus basilensis]MDF3836239.1 isochorismatase family protein [Cupriavidus basilensis]
MLHNAAESTLVLVDFQARLMPAIHDGDRVVKEAIRLANIARVLGVPIVGTEQSPGSLGENLDEIKRLCDRTVAKDHFDACRDGLPDALPAGRKHVVVAGCEAHVCVLQTVAGLLDHGLKVTVVLDAIGSRKRASYEAAVDRMRRDGATAATVEMIAFEWLRTSRHERFREVLGLVK